MAPFDELSITITGPTLQVAQAQVIMERLGLPVDLSSGVGQHTGVDGVACVTFRGQRSRPVSFRARGPRRSPAGGQHR